MSDENNFKKNLEKIQQLNPDHLMWARPKKPDGEEFNYGVIDYDGSKGNFEEGMEMMLALERASITVVKDYPKLSDAMSYLLDIALTQEARINDLENELNNVRSEKVAIAVQEHAKNLIEDLANKGYSTGNQKLSITIEEDSTSKSSENTESVTDKKLNADAQLQIKGLAKVLAGLDVNADVKKDFMEKEIRSLSQSSKKSKAANLHWEIDSATPPSDPKAHAEAYRRRLGEMPKTDGKTKVFNILILGFLLINFSLVIFLLLDR